MKSVLSKKGKVPIIEGLTKPEIKMWIAFCKSVNNSLSA